jgi:sugar transferase (PEP-CTERM/EpsH1 system associated)
MNILYLSLRFPYPPHSGDKIRTYNILKHLSQRHSISFISFVQSPEEASCAGYLREYCDQVKTVEFSKLKAYGNCLLYFSFAEPFQVAYWHSQGMQRQVDEMMNRNGFDIIHVQFFRMAQYVTKYTNKRKILDSGDSFSLNLNRRSRLDRGLSWPLLKVEANKVRTYETEITQWFDKVTMVSALDRDYLLSINGGAPKNPPNPLFKGELLSVVPMGVDLEYYQPSDPQAGMPVPPNLLFTGTIRYFPNKDAVLYFYNEIFPLIRSAVSNAKFYIVGNHPPKKISKLMSGGDVIVTGRVEDVRPYFAKSAVFVCPLRSGSGMQTKILEAMAMGVPVVTTSMGAEAFEEAIAGRDIIIADDAKRFAAEVISLLKDKELRQSVAQNARKLVQKKYGWSSVVKRLDMIYERLKTQDSRHKIRES